MTGPGALANIFKLPDLRKKIIFTLAILFVYRIGFHIPLPGTDPEVLRGYTERTSGNSIFGLLDVLSGGRLQLPTLFSLGILPYISASIIFSLLAKVIPRLEEMAKEGPAGQRKINQLTRLATVPLCIAQGFVLVYTQFRYLSAEVHGANEIALMVPGLGAENGFFVVFLMATVQVLGMTAGTLFVMWLGEQITDSGVGNGASLIIMSGILTGLPSAVSNLTKAALEDRSKILIAALLVVIYVAVVWTVVLITKGQRRIPIQINKVAQGKRMMGGQKSYLPLKVNMANVMPVIFASSLLMFPNLIAGAFGAQHRFLPVGGWWYITLYVALIFFFSFFWTSMMFQPTEMANNLKEYGSFIPGIRPGKKTAEYLETVMVRITIVGSAFLALIAVLPTLVADQLDLDQSITSLIGGTSILIVVGVALDLVDKLNSQLLMRDYEGFMSASSSKRGRRSGGY